MGISIALQIRLGTAGGFLLLLRSACFPYTFRNRRDWFVFVCLFHTNTSGIRIGKMYENIRHKQYLLRGRKAPVDWDSFVIPSERGQHVDEYMKKMRENDRL